MSSRYSCRTCIIDPTRPRASYFFPYDKTGDQAEIGYTENLASGQQFYTQICWQVQGAGEVCHHPAKIPPARVNHFVGFRIANSPTSSNTFVGWYNIGSSRCRRLRHDLYPGRGAQRVRDHDVRRRREWDI